MSDYVIAIDGGGTKCRACLYSPEGEIVAFSVTGPANIFSDFPLAMANIQDAIEQIFTQEQVLNKIEKPELCILSAGCAGAFISSARMAFKDHFSQYKNVLVFSDLQASCVAANNNQNCGLVVTGTGSSMARYFDGEISQFGGHGFLLGDNASGAFLGKKLIQDYLLFLDGVLAYDNIFTPLQEKIGDNKSSIVTEFAKSTAVTFAQLARIIIANKNSSHLASGYLEQSTDYLISMIKQNLSDLPVFLDGGLASTYLQLLNAKKVEIELQLTENPAEYGAFLLAQESA
ncbi:BadF/BadG/BcrA/BcrD ATPase family protein [Glaciecola sp. 1036]|uniref:BadF/BadG/BcrA/BcrD ATPase family protein n=1 Tax=Alteromonadaceae TaxID=72275 RepID=UPI003D0745C2